jgi:hypothetical protein
MHDSANKETSFIAENGKACWANDGVIRCLKLLLNDGLWRVIEQVDTLTVMKKL